MAYVESQYQVQLDHKGCQADNVILRSSICHVALLLSVTAFVTGVNVIVMQCAMSSVAEHTFASHLGSLLPTSFM